jgi:formylglycine-generating enzyme required for sulfatase activity
MKKFLSPIVLVALFSPALATVTMDWVTVGNPGNVADPLTGYGAVDYAYQIGKYEVTNAQYCEFLNAMGSSNSGSIYNPEMSGYGIQRRGDFGNYVYNVTAALANRPVVYVSWFDAARFANWMMNGQGNSDMENGAYSLNGSTSGIILANPGAKFNIPSEDEWYKAAYYNAANMTYSIYPNGQDTISPADANYNSGASSDVGSYSDDPSGYGTFDQAGNVFEWNDSVISDTYRGNRGGNMVNDESQILSSNRVGIFSPAFEDAGFGFRLASVPEPTSMVLTMLASGMMLIRRKR